MSEMRSLYGKLDPLNPLREAIAKLEAAQEAIDNLPASIGPKPYIKEQTRWMLDSLRRRLESEEAAALEARTA
jgi:hypothetical protein